MISSSSTLFTPLKIRGLTIPNRFMRSATWEGKATSTGLPTKQLKQMMVDLSIGQTGLIVPGYCYPIEHGQAAFNQLGMSKYAHGQTWESTIDIIHKNGSKIMFQVCHGGVRCPSNLIHQQPIGVSPESEGQREMTQTEIEDTIDSFIKSALRIQQMGADAIQIHAAHGYLISSFLSPYLNKRKDLWGGSFENRARFLKETIKTIRQVCSSNFVISVKINGNDCIQGGFIPEMAGDLIKSLPEVDFWEISAGIGPKSYGIRSIVDWKFLKKKIPKNDFIETEKKIHILTDGVQYSEAYNYESAKIIHEIAPNAKLALVGGNRNPKNMEKLLNEGNISLISL